MLQTERNVGRRIESPMRIFLQAVMHDSLQHRRYVAIRRAQIRWLFVQDRAYRVGGSVPPEGALAREHLVENGPKTENVGARIKRLSPPCSGDIYPTVPNTTPASVPRLAVATEVCALGSICVSFARPKSRIFTRLSFVMNKFSGLKSRWRMPLPCAAASPSAVCRA